MIRQALDVLWREYPEESRTFDNVKRRADEVYNRNTRVWSAIKKPSPQAFFENLLPYPADGFFRQAMVLCWMMMPRTGGRDVADVRKIISQMYQRNVEAWQADNRLFTADRKPAGKKAKKQKPVKTSKKSTRKKPAAKQSKRK